MSVKEKDEKVFKGVDYIKTYADDGCCDGGNKQVLIEQVKTEQSSNRRIAEYFDKMK